MCFKEISKCHFNRSWVVLGIILCLVLVCSCQVDQQPYYQRVTVDLVSFPAQFDPLEEQEGLFTRNELQEGSSDMFFATNQQDRESGEYYVWETGLWFGDKDETMTPELCQDWMDWFQADTTFFAIRFPVLDNRFSSAITMPVTFQAPFTPTLVLLDETSYPATGVFTIPLVYRPELVELAEAELPAKEGEQWLVLGVDPAAGGFCPPELNLPAEEWEFQAKVWFDFGGTREACVECVMLLYYCHQGQESPFFLDQDGRASGVDEITVQDQAITAVGPHPIRLKDTIAPTPPFYIQGGKTDFVEPPATLTVTHYLILQGTGPVSVTFDLSSKLGLDWGIYAGTVDAPYQPLIPIDDPFILSDFAPIWLIADVPAGAPDGAETLIITATDVLSASRSTWGSDVLWIGEWIPPSGQVEWDYHVFLPVVLK